MKRSADSARSGTRARRVPRPRAPARAGRDRRCRVRARRRARAARAGCAGTARQCAAACAAWSSAASAASEECGMLSSSVDRARDGICAVVRAPRRPSGPSPWRSSRMCTVPGAVRSRPLRRSRRHPRSGRRPLHACPTPRRTGSARAGARAPAPRRPAATSPSRARRARCARTPRGRRSDPTATRMRVG